MRFSGSATRRGILLLIALAGMFLTGAALHTSVAHAASTISTQGGSYQRINLVSDIAGKAPVTDPNLKNPWGLVSSPTSPWWVSNNNSGTSTLYQGTGAIVPLVVNTPLPGGKPGGAPTGIVFNGDSSSFMVTENGTSGASIFLFDTEDGTIEGWSPGVDRTNAIIAVDRSAMGAVYKGLAIGTSNNQTFIYAANFRSGMIEMFNGQFQMTQAFTDAVLTHICVQHGQCFAPFGIQNIGGNLYVTFALQDAARHDDVPGPGHGFVDVFSTSGQLMRRLAFGFELNSPWGLAMAPSNFGQFSNDLLVGNFGNGHINAFNPMTGEFLGQLENKMGQPMTISGLWSLQFGNGQAAGATNQLFFTAGINNTNDGLLGDIQTA